MMAKLARALTTAELPVLEAHGLSMWAYVVLLSLRSEPVRTQAALAQSIGADKTRIIAVLDDLQTRGLIDRQPDQSDRRAHVLSLTDEGRRVRDAAQAEIQRREELLLDRLSPADRRGFMRALQQLSTLPPEEITGGRTP